MPTDQAIDAALDAIDERTEGAVPSPTTEETSGGSSTPVPIPPPFAGPPERSAPILDDIDFTCRTILRRTAAWRAAAAC